MNRLTVRDGRIYLDDIEVTGCVQLHIDMDADEQPQARVQLVLVADVRELQVDQDVQVRLVHTETNPKHELPPTGQIVDNHWIPER